MMRRYWIALPLILAPVPAMAAPKDAPEVPRELGDPAMADRLGKVAGALTRALMDLPVGEVEAAVEGRDPAAGDRERRMRDHFGGPDLDRRVEAQVAKSGKKAQKLGKALMAALPSIMASLDDIEHEVERATANIPDPAYPRR